MRRKAGTVRIMVWRVDIVVDISLVCSSGRITQRHIAGCAYGILAQHLIVSTVNVGGLIPSIATVCRTFHDRIAIIVYRLTRHRILLIEHVTVKSFSDPASIGCSGVIDVIDLTTVGIDLNAVCQRFINHIEHDITIWHSCSVKTKWSSLPFRVIIKSCKVISFFRLNSRNF